MVDGSQKLNKRIELGCGLFVFLVSLFVFYDTIAQTTSFWDCGEFIACSRILGVMHPPGAPLYLLIGRILTMIPLFTDIGMRVNIFSAFVSAATVFFTFLVITQLIRRWRGPAKTLEDRIIMYVSGVLGALAFAFTDSFWFNAVEAEVYAFSMFFTALVVWLALYWGEHSEKVGNILIILFIFYLFGLATGVHLLNILTFPFVLLIAFFHDNQQVRRLLMLLFVQAAVPILLYVLFYQFNPESMPYDEIIAHQAKAGGFLKWFGLIWIGLTLIYIYRKDRFVFKIWWAIPVLVLVAYSTYVVIYLRATLAPPINENDPSTLKGMQDYLARKQYGTEDLLLTFLFRKADFWQYQIHKMYTRYFGWQFIGKGTTLDFRDRIIEIISLKGLYGLPFFVGLWGTLHHFSRDWKRAVAVLVLFLLTGYAIILYLNQPDPQPRERDYSFVGSFFAFAIWIGMGMAGIFEGFGQLLAKKHKLKMAAYGLIGLFLFVIVPLNLYAFNRESHNRRGNFVAYDYSYNILESCEEDAIIFTNGDNDTFPLWFLQEVYGIRKDVRVVNLSLLNTQWYIKQLRDQEPKVPIYMSDRKIEELFYREWETQQFGITIPPEIREQEIVYQKSRRPGFDEKNVPHQMTFSLSPTYPENNPRVLRVQDLMVLYILEKAQWMRPVYFAVTVARNNMLGLDRFLRMDGLAYKVMPYPRGVIDPERLKDNLINKFQYRGLDDQNVYFDVNIVKLLQNYRSAYIQLIRHFLNTDEKDNASAILDEMSRKIPANHVPYSHERLAVMVADFYKRVGRSPEAEKQRDFILPGTGLSHKERLLLQSYHAQAMKDWDQAEAYLLELIEEDANDVDAVSELLRMYHLSKQYEKGIDILESWLQRNPGDPNARKQLELLRSMVSEQSEGIAEGQGG